MEQQSFLNELKTNVETRCALWRIGWLGKMVCSPIFWIVLFLFVRFEVNEHSFLAAGDTSSYTFYYNSNIFKGETDLNRTPLYPTFIRCIQKILNDEKICQVDANLYSFDDITQKNSFSFKPYIQEDRITSLATFGKIPTYTVPVYKPTLIDTHIKISNQKTVKSIILSGQKSCPYIVFTQLIIWLISLSFFYMALKKCFSNSCIVFLLVLFIGNLFLFEHRWILTEPLGLSMTLIMFSMLINYIYNPNSLLAICINGMAFLMVMLRPAFLIFYVLLLGFWFAQLFFTHNRKRICILGLFTLLLSSSFVYGYCELNRRNHGVFTISVVGTINQSDILIQTGFYKKSLNAKFINFLDKQNIDSSAVCQYDIQSKFINEFGFNALKDYTDETIKNNLISYMILTLKRMYWDMNISGFQSIYAIILIEFFFILFLWITYKSFPWIRLTFWLYCSVMLFGIYYGCPDSYERLIKPTLPIYFIICARYIDLLFVAYSKSKKEFIKYLKSAL